MGSMLQAAEYLWNLLEAAWEIVYWRKDWHRTWSPVSWWLAVFSVIALLVLLSAWLAP